MSREQTEAELKASQIVIEIQNDRMKRDAQKRFREEYLTDPVDQNCNCGQCVAARRSVVWSHHSEPNTDKAVVGKLSKRITA